MSNAASNHLPATLHAPVRRQRRHADCDLAAWSAAGPGSRFIVLSDPQNANVVVQAIITLADDPHGRYGVAPDGQPRTPWKRLRCTRKTWPGLT